MSSRVETVVVHEPYFWRRVWATVALIVVGIALNIAVNVGVSYYGSDLALKQVNGTDEDYAKVNAFTQVPWNGIVWFVVLVALATVWITYATRMYRFRNAKPLA